MDPIFRRAKENPILTSEDMPVRAEAVLNPGATEQDGRVALLVRAEHASGFSDVYVARSSNGVTDWEVAPEPLLEHGLPKMRYESWGCEDPRVVFLEEHECWYITYTAYSPAGAAVGLAKSADLETAERVGLIFSPNNKDAALFPREVGERFVVVHRPDAGGGIENIWIAFSPDLLHWGEPHCVLPEGAGPAWDAHKVGAGPPPVETDNGWLILYHGVKMYAGQMAYRVGAAMLDRDQPHKVIGRTRENIFKASAIYEMAGLVPNVVFPTGMLLRGDELWVYYGAADTTICLAVAKLQDVLNLLEPEEHVET